jgi:hypothetical protein
MAVAREVSNKLEKLGSAYVWMGMPRRVQEMIPHVQKLVSSHNGMLNKPSPLWSDYQIHIARKHHQPRPKQFLATVNLALRPALQWRDLAQQCLRYHFFLPRQVYFSNDNNNKKSAGDDNNEADAGSSKLATGYAVLHARVESDMHRHKCGATMEKNLTKILDMVDALVKDFNDNNSMITTTTTPGNHSHGGSKSTIIRETMVAIARGLMLPHNDLAIQNWKVLNERSISYTNHTYKFDATRQSSPSRQYDIDVRDNHDDHVFFECGQGWLREAFYRNPSRNTRQLPDQYYGDILPAILDFEMAVQADIFVGVMHSSWSTDVWTTRYYQGKGQRNFHYTKEDNRIIPVPNNGLPPVHTKC